MRAYGNTIIKSSLILASLLLSLYVQAAEVSPPKETPLFTRAREAQNRGDWELAIVSYLKYLETNPNNTSALHNIASVYLAKKLAVRALFHLDHLLALEPGDGEAFIKRGRAYALLNEFAKAEENFNTGVRLYPKADSYFYRAQYWFDRGDFAKSELDFEEVIRQAPKMTIVHLQLAKAYLNEKKFSKAVDVYTRGIELRSHPNVTSDFLYFRGLAYEDLGQTQNALRDYDEAISMTGQKPQIFCNRGRLLFSLGQRDVGMADMNLALLMVPNYGLCYAFRSRAHLIEGTLSAAESDAEKAVRFAPNESESYLVRGLVHSKKEEFQLSVAAYTRAIEMMPDNYQAFTNRAYDWASLKDFEKSDADLEKALSISPKRQDTYTYLTDFYMRQGQYERAVKLASRGISLYPELVELYLARGESLEALKQYEQAVPDLEYACKKGDKWGCTRLEWTKKAIEQSKQP